MITGVNGTNCLQEFHPQGGSILHRVEKRGDLLRFEHPSQLMAYLCLVPREQTSGDRRQDCLSQDVWLLSPVAAAGHFDDSGVVEEAVEDGAGGWDISDQPPMGRFDVILADRFSSWHT